MFARVEIDHGSISRVVVPDRAVVKQTGSGNRYVYVLHGNTVSYNRVELDDALTTPTSLSTVSPTETPW